MILDKFGDVIVDILTTNPVLSTIPSASAILDTSNYTLQAASFGKDGEGFKYHSHIISASSSSLYNSGILIVSAHNILSPSSYHASGTHALSSSTYNSVPSYPHPSDTRLDRKSTLTNLPTDEDIDWDPPDNGQYLNPVLYATIGQPQQKAVSALWNVIGGFGPPSATPGEYYFYNSVSSPSYLFSGVVSSFYNTHNLMDINGFLKFSDLNGSAFAAHNAWDLGPGVVASAATNSVSAGACLISLVISTGDLVTLAAFGGVNHIGLWCFDMEQMLEDGLRPPFSWNTINNLRKYRLVAKKTFWDNLLRHEDATDGTIQTDLAAAGLPYAGFKTFMENGYNNYAGTYNGMRINFNFNFT